MYFEFCFIRYHQIFKVDLDGPAKSSNFRRFIWCKYVPDELTTGVASIKDCAYQFAVLLDDMVSFSIVDLTHLYLKCSFKFL